MATIILKGTDKKLECTIAQCTTINKMKEEGANPKTPLNVAGTVVELGDIRYAIPDEERDRVLKSEATKESNDKYLEEVGKEYRNEMIRVIKLPIQEKAKIVTLPKLMYQAYTGSVNAPQEFLDEVMARQLDYFKEHPTHAFANPTCYKDLLKVAEDRQTPDRANYINTCRTALVRIVQRTIEESFFVLRSLRY